MPIQLQGNSGTIVEVGGTTFRGMRVEARPIEYGSFGHYRVAQTVGLVATQTANGTLFSFRWGDATRLAAITYMRLQLMQTAAATATIWPRYQIFVARSFTASDSSGTAITLTGNNMKKRTNMGTTLVTDMRFSAAAAGLTVGTRTLDANPIMEMPTNSTITTPNAVLYSAVLDMEAGDMPIILAQNEGFIVRGPTTAFGAAGTADLVVDVAWAEVSSY